MPRIGSTAEIAVLERRLDDQNRFIDLAVRLRVLDSDGKPGRYLPHTIGGRWDRWFSRWAPAEAASMKTWDWTIQEQQIPLIFETPKSVLLVALFAGRQAGKTQVGVMEVVKDAIRWPGRKSAIISLDFKASRDPEDAFRALLAPHWEVKENRTDRAYTFPNGHVVVFRSEEAINSVRGPSLKTILLDEAAYYQASSYLTAVGCGMASEDFRLLIATTPKRESEWIRKVDAEWDKKPGSMIYRLRTEDNPRRNKVLLDRIKDDTPADMYAQEFEGRVVSPADAVYGLFRRDRHLQPIPKTGDFTRKFTAREFGVAAEYLMGWDFGKEAVIIAKVFRGTKEITDDRGRVSHVPVEYLWIVGEEYNDRTTTEHHARAVADKWGTSACVVTDAMGAHDRVEGRGAGTAAITLLREAGFLRVDPVAARNPDVLQRVRTVNRLLLNVEQETRLFIVPGACPRLVDALENQEMKHGKPEKEGRHEHILDALGYLVYAAMPVRGALPETFIRPFAREVE